MYLNMNPLSFSNTAFEINIIQYSTVRKLKKTPISFNEIHITANRPSICKNQNRYHLPSKCTSINLKHWLHKNKNNPKNNHCLFLRFLHSTVCNKNKFSWIQIISNYFLHLLTKYKIRDILHEKKIIYEHT